jgi:hypothetical protein
VAAAEEEEEEEEEVSLLSYKRRAPSNVDDDVREEEKKVAKLRSEVDAMMMKGKFSKKVMEEGERRLAILRAMRDTLSLEVAHLREEHEAAISMHESKMASIAPQEKVLNDEIKALQAIRDTMMQVRMERRREGEEEKGA